jgi:guanylate kinase
MSGNNQGIIVVLSSPSGAGKTTLVKEISRKNNYQISISHTTRKPRSIEKDGKDYYFVSDSEFKNLIDEDRFLEYAKVFQHYYGSSKDTVLKKLESGQNVIFDIDWQGTEQIKKQKLNYRILTIFILPPSRDELYKRLLNRDRNDEKIVKERMAQFNEDVLHWKDYDFVVINDDLENCYKKIIKFIESGDNEHDPNYQKLISLHVNSLLN